MYRMLLVAGLVLAAAPAFGANPPASETASAGAKKNFQAAQKLYKQGRYLDAIAKFEEAYRLKPHAVIFFNLGKCNEQLGNFATALRSYRDYLRAMPDAIDAEAVRDAVANMERRLREKGVQQVIVYAEPPDATIAIDANEVGRSPASVELAPGDHRLSVRLAGHESLERTFTMSLRKSSELSVVLKPVAQVTAPAAAIPPPVTPSDAKPTEVAPPLTVAPLQPVVEVAPPPPASGGRRWTYVAAGLAGAGIAGGAVFGSSAKSASDQMLSGIHARSEVQGLYDSANSSATLSNASYGVAVAAGVTAIVLFFLEPGPAAKPAATF